MLDPSVKILIVGKLGTRKNELAHLIADAADATIVRSITTRPANPQYPDEHLHVDTFEAESLRDASVAHVVINGFEYFTTRREFENHNIFVIDPTGALNIIEQYPNYPFVVVYSLDNDDERRLSRVNPDELANRKALLIRDANESLHMDRFTTIMDPNNPDRPKNVEEWLVVSPVHDDTFEAGAHVVAKRATQYNRIVVHHIEEDLPTPPCTIEVVFTPIRDGVDKNWRTIELDVKENQTIQDAIQVYLKRQHLPLDYPIESITEI